MITSRRMAAIDRNAAALGVDTRVLMESAGNAVAREVTEEASAGAEVTIVCGRGDNGGDGFAASRFLSEYAVTVVLVGDPTGINSSAARANWATLEQTAIECEVCRDSTAIPDLDADVVVDALLGSGIRGEVREPIRSAIEAINEAAGHVVSVDIPSGVDPDTGDAQGIAVDADSVITFHDAKPGHDSLDVPVTVADIGIPDAAERFVGPGDRFVLDGRAMDAHKGDHGRVLVVGGGPYTGAPALTGLAALRAGTDLVEVATPVGDAVASMSPDLIVNDLSGDHLTGDHIEELNEASERADVLAIGPGLGNHPETLDAATRLIEAEVETVVVDADALAVVSTANPSADLICTPHAGEFAEMGFTAPDGWEARETVVAEAAQDLDATVLLKGGFDVISDGDRTAVNRTGNPGMTVGGTGDVLTGVTAALAHRGSPIEAAAVGAWVNGRAGDACLDEIGFGFLASDVVGALPGAMARSDEA